MSDHRFELPVLIAGGGPAGLFASVSLSDLATPHLLVERHAGTAIAPKAHIINPRTIENFAQHGLAELVYAEGTPRENNATTRWITSLGGDKPWNRHNFHTVDSWAGNALEAHYRPLSPFLHGNWQQNRLEPALWREAERRNPGRVLFQHELVEFTPDDDGVTATVRDRSAEETFTVRAQYLIGADGGKTVGRAVGIEMLGPPPFAAAYSLHFKADLSPWLEHDDCVIRLGARPSLDGPPILFGLLAMGPTWDRHAGDWAMHVVVPLEEAGRFGQAGPARWLPTIREMLELPELEAEIVGTSDWLIEAVIADRYRVGRTFVVGDAAHRHSPMGGLGLNTAIQDVHNLTWKLAHVIGDRADPALLETYEPERRPVGARNVEFSTGCFIRHLSANAGFGTLPGAPREHTEAVLSALFADTEDGATRRAALGEFYNTLRYEFQAADIELGYHYGADAAIVPDGTEPPPRDPTGHDTIQTARPGHRLPHATIDDGSGRRSTQSLLRTGAFLVLAGSDGAAWVEAARRLGERRRIEIDAYRVGRDADLRDAGGAWTWLRGHGDGGAILVRPDAHVAFRAAALVDDPEGALGHALDMALGRGRAYAGAR